MAYIYGQLVTEAEKAFLTTILTEKTKLEQVKHLKAIRQTALRNNTSLVNAALIFENNKKSVEILNKNSNTSTQYKLNKEGKVCIIKYDKYGNSFSRELLQEEKDKLNRKNSSQHKINSPFLNRVKNKIKNFFIYLSEMLEVY